jgi:hypothetical protein
MTTITIATTGWLKMQGLSDLAAIVAALIVLWAAGV